MSEPDTVVRRDAIQTAGLLLTLLLSLSGVIGLSVWKEQKGDGAAGRAPTAEELYLTPEKVNRLVPAPFRGLVADWYWMRALQYVGRKMHAYPGALRLDDLSPLDLRLLAPLLETVTTIDPQFYAAYAYGALVLPDVDLPAAIALTRKGIAADPTNWRLYHYLGYIYWQHKDFAAASEAYRAGAQVPGAPDWMRIMSLQMEAEGHGRKFAREMFMRLYEESEDQHFKLLAFNRLLYLQAEEERELLRRLLEHYRKATGRCPPTWAQIAELLRAAGLKLDAAGAPLDPSGLPYLLQTEPCEAALDPRSEVPRR